MAAESGGGGLMKVLGEYGVFLVEMGSLQDVYSSIKTMSRIKHTCMSTGRKYIAVGTTSGGVYIYNRKTLEYVRLISTKDGPITKLCFALEKSYLGVATSLGIVLVIDVGSRTRDKPKCLRRSEEHKNTKVTCFCWDDNDSQLFAGDDQGFVSAIYLPTIKSRPSVSHPKKSLIHHKSAVVGKSETAINQLDYAAEKLLISTMTKTAVLDLATSQCWVVGSKPREGIFGACFLKQLYQESPTIYTARPGSRLWEASMDGQVISTQHYKQLLAVPPSPVLGYGHDAQTTHLKNEEKPKAISFAKLFLIRERFLLSWLGNNIYLIDPVLGQLAGWYQLRQAEISDVCCHGNQFYIYHGDGHMTWYGVLTVKETVAWLFEINDYNQCIKVALECKSYLIPGTARDWVPVSMVTSLIMSIQEQPDSEELLDSLQELEQLLQKNANISTDRPPDFYGDSNLHGSPDSMSVNSDVCSHHMDSGLEDDDNLSVNQGDINGEHASGFQKNKEFSLENALLSVAAKAKKFAEERQKSKKFKLPNFGKTSINSEIEETIQTNGINQETNDDYMNEGARNVTNEEPSIEEFSGKADSSASEMSSGVPRKTASLGLPGSDMVDLSDDDALDTRKTKEKARDKKKKKRRVITVDINTPASKTPEIKSGLPRGRVCSDSNSKLEDTKMKLQRSYSERSSPTPFVTTPTMNNVPSELPPAIPAMLSKAKVLIKRKLTPGETSEDSPFDLILSQSSSAQNESDSTDEDEEKDDLVQLPRPVTVEELEKLTNKIRQEVRTPKILYNRRALRSVLQEWIPVLSSAFDSCKESCPSQNPGQCLKNWLSESCYADVCMLTKMCLDTGVYGETASETRDQNDCSRERNELQPSVKREVDERSRDHKEMPRGYSGLENEIKTVVEISSQGKLTCDVMTRDQEICSRDDSIIDSDRMKNTRETTRDQSCDSDKGIENTIPSNRDDVMTRDEDFLGGKRETMEDSGESPRDHDIARSENCSCDLDVREVEQADSSVNSLLKHELQSEWTCEPCIRNHHSILNRILITDLSQSSREAQAEKKRDWARAWFIRRYFELLKVKDIRRTLGVSPGCKYTSWSVLLECIKGSSKQDDVSNHIKDGHVTRALHVLHDGILEYQDSILLHLVNLYELNGRETLMTCVRMYPDVLPWEVMEICQQGTSRDAQTGAQYFVYYVDQLLRWRLDFRERRIQTVNTLCDDKEFTRIWFHDTLIASNSDSQRHCQCGLPRLGSHKLPWKHEEYLQQMLDIVVHRRDVSEMAVFLDMCWKHGYWTGVLRLCAAKHHRYPIIQVIVSLGDMNLLEADKPWGPTPQCLDEWKTLLELVALKTSHAQQQQDGSQHACAVNKDSDWTADINWENVVHLALKRLGASRLVPLLQDVPYQEMSLPVDFYHKCIMGVVIEKEQSNVIHQMLTKLDSYFWSKRAGVLTPEMNYQRIQEQESKQSKENSSVSSVNSMSRVKTLEDAATNWGVNIHLADAVCPVCTLQLGEQVSSSNQGLLVFDCGHVFHRFCVPERACVVCFHQSLKTLGKARMRMLNEESAVHLI